MEAFRLLCRTEGIIPALESAHALVGAMEVGRELGPDALLLVNLSGRGDKDMETAADVLRPPRRGVVVTTTVRGVEEVLRRCRDEGRAALVGYLPVGFPTVEGSLEAMRVLVEAGCDVIEVGVPYSDPLMDGAGHPARRGHRAGRRHPRRRRLPGDGGGARRPVAPRSS